MIYRIYDPEGNHCVSQKAGSAREALEIRVAQGEARLLSELRDGLYIVVPAEPWTRNRAWAGIFRLGPPPEPQTRQIKQVT